MERSNPYRSSGSTRSRCRRSSSKRKRSMKKSFVGARQSGQYFTIQQHRPGSACFQSVSVASPSLSLSLSPSRQHYPQLPPRWAKGTEGRKERDGKDGDGMVRGRRICSIIRIVHKYPGEPNDPRNVAIKGENFCGCCRTLISTRRRKIRLESCDALEVLTRKYEEI